MQFLFSFALYNISREKYLDDLLNTDINLTLLNSQQLFILIMSNEHDENNKIICDLIDFIDINFSTRNLGLIKRHFDLYALNFK